MFLAERGGDGAIEFCDRHRVVVLEFGGQIIPNWSEFLQNFCPTSFTNNGQASMPELPNESQLNLEQISRHGNATDTLFRAEGRMGKSSFRT